MSKPLNLNPMYRKPGDCPKAIVGKVKPPPESIPFERRLTMEEAQLGIAAAVQAGFWTLHTGFKDGSCAVSLVLGGVMRGTFYSWPDLIGYLEGDEVEEMEAAELTGFDPLTGTFEG